MMSSNTLYQLLLKRVKVTDWFISLAVVTLYGFDQQRLILYVCRLWDMDTGDKHTISTFVDQTHIQRTRPRRKTVFFKTSLRVLLL